MATHCTLISPTLLQWLQSQPSIAGEDHGPVQHPDMYGRFTASETDRTPSRLRIFDGETNASGQIRNDVFFLLEAQGYLRNAKRVRDPVAAYTEALRALPEDKVYEIASVYHRLRDVFAFYQDVFGRTSFDGDNCPILACVNISDDNAFWYNNGHCGPHLEGTHGIAVFGPAIPGETNALGLLLDVVAHELTHGSQYTKSRRHTQLILVVITHTSRLTYIGESGALNESLADCFGVMAKQWKLQQTDPANADWKLGNGWQVNHPGRPLRNFSNPGACNQPQSYDGFRYLGDGEAPSGNNDSGWVHYNSGIGNHAFYLAVIWTAEPSWKTVGQIWYRAMVDKKLRPNSDFQKFAKLTLKHARVVGGSAAWNVYNAWQSVAVPLSWI